MRLSAFDTYSLYLAIRQHFTQDSYDYFKYHGKTRANNESFIQRKDRYQFQKLSRKYTSEEMLDFLVANAVRGTTWVGDLLNDECHDSYMAYLKRKQSLAYSFGNELDALFTQEPPDITFKVGKGHLYLPPILNARMCDTVSAETFVILDRFIGFSKTIERSLGENLFLWNRYNKPAQKLHPFLSYDKDKMKSILKEKINEHRLPSERYETSRAPQTQGATI